MEDRAFVRGDGVGSVIEGGADVVYGGLAGFDVEGGGFEEDVGLGCGEPGADVFGGFRFARLGGGRACDVCFGIEAFRVGDPSQAARGDAGDAEGDSVTLAQFSGAVLEEAD